MIAVGYAAVAGVLSIANSITSTVPATRVEVVNLKDALKNDTTATKTTATTSSTPSATEAKAASAANSHGGLQAPKTKNTVTKP